MSEHTSAMRDLVAALDAELEESPPDLLRLGRILDRTALGVTDVLPWISERDGTYHRATVVRRDGYELLVITWKRGQGSHPHDHTGSISALKVIAGRAAEDTFVIDDEGYAVPVASCPLPTGALTAWHDAGVHSVRNVGRDTLVTVNVYAPPLGQFRRFHVRPVTAVASPAAARGRRTVLVVGGGFSGTMAAAQLVRQAELAGIDLRVVLAERTGVIGEGIAYGTSDESHLLNVPAGRMSAWPDKPDDFVAWVGRTIRRVDPWEFVPRAWYGRYVRETLLAVRRGSRRASCEHVFDETRRLSRRREGGWVAHFAAQAVRSSQTTWSSRSGTALRPTRSRVAGTARGIATCRIPGARSRCGRSSPMHRSSSSEAGSPRSTRSSRSAPHPGRHRSTSCPDADCCRASTSNRVCQRPI